MNVNVASSHGHDERSVAQRTHQRNLGHRHRVAKRLFFLSSRGPVRFGNKGSRGVYMLLTVRVVDSPFVCGLYIIIINATHIILGTTSIFACLFEHKK